jgi:hypothetical protein
VSRLLAFVRTRAGFVATIGIVLAIAGVVAALVLRGTAPQPLSVRPTHFSDEMEARLTGFGFTITAINPSGSS